MERELLDAFEAARKAADAVAADEGEQSAEAARCVYALRRLRDARVTTASLVSTQVGKCLRYLTKHAHAGIKATGLDLLGCWKRVVIEEAEKKNGAPQNGKSNNTVVKVEKAKPMKVEKVSASPRANITKSDMNVSVMKSQGVKVEKIFDNELKAQSIKVEKVSKEYSEDSAVENLSPVQSVPPTLKLTSIVRCNDANRDKVRGTLGDAFSKVSEETRKDDREEVRNILDEVEACDPFRVAVTVECALFQRLGDLTGPNKAKYRSLMFNLKAGNNTDFRRKVLLGQVKPERIADLTPSEMASDTRKLQSKKIEEKALFECERGGAPKETIDQFKCSRCGQRKTTYCQMQTRSADEPMTTYVTCVNCNNHWKFC